MESLQLCSKEMEREHRQQLLGSIQVLAQQIKCR